MLRALGSKILDCFHIFPCSQFRFGILSSFFCSGFTVGEPYLLAQEFEEDFMLGWFI